MEAKIQQQLVMEIKKTTAVGNGGQNSNCSWKERSKQQQLVMEAKTTIAVGTVATAIGTI